MNFFNKISILFVSLVLVSITFAAQGQGQQREEQKADTITNEELKKVATTLQEAQVIQQEANTKLRELVKEEGIEYNRFQLIVLSKQNTSIADSLNITDKEEAAFQRLQPRLVEINQQSTQKFNKAIQENELTRQRLQQIMQGLQTKPALAQRFQKIVAEMRANNQGT